MYDEEDVNIVSIEEQCAEVKNISKESENYMHINNNDS